MYWAFVTRAVKLRRRRLQLAFAAMAVVAALATALFTVYSDVEKKIGAQFQAYGANLVIAPAGTSVTVPLRAVEEARKAGAMAVPFLYLPGKIMLTGVDFHAAAPLLPFWHIEGTPGDCMAGVALGLHLGDTARAGDFSCVVSSIVSTGGAEDTQLILPFATVAHLARIGGAASLVQVRVSGDRLDAVRQALQRALPETDVRTVRAVAETETSVVLKMRSALFLLMAIIVAIATMSIGSNFGELVMERSKEIGILKAIGAGEAKIAALLISESLVLALFSTLAGYALGVMLAGWIDSSVFSSAFQIRVNFTALFLAGLVTLLVAVAATAFSAGRIWRIEPAAILRGE